MAGWNAINDNILYSLSVHSDTLAKLQEQVSTGSKVNRASDDPDSYLQITQAQKQTNTYSSYMENIDEISSDLNLSDSMLEQVSSAITRASTLVTQGANSTYSDADRESMADEINSLLEECVSLANTKNVGKYLFGGSNTTSQPYVTQTSDGEITAVTYQGSSSSLPAPVADGMTYSGSLVGDSIFRSSDRQEPVFFGATGAQAGSGSSSLCGTALLSVTHNTTTYDGTSGIAAGTRSAAGDTIVGDHSISIDAANKTVTLDDGSAVSFTGSETNLEVQTASGDIVYLDMTGWDGTGGTVALSATADISLDGGLTKTTVSDFTADNDNLAVTDSISGGTLYVNASGIKRTGDDVVTVPGTNDVFSALILARDTLSNTNNLSEEDYNDMLDQSLAALTEASEKVASSLAVVGGQVGAMEDLKNSLDTANTAMSDQLDSLQSADVTEITVELTSTQNLYQLTLSVAAKLLETSLLNYLS
jgi:flagellar hook-associated protein 3 FlgL